MNVNWISPTGGLWSVGENWSGGLVPSTNDVAVFSTIYGSGDITIDQNVVCSGITVSGNYNGNMTSAGYGYYLTGNYIDDGTGSRNLGSGMIFNNPNTTGHFGSTLGTVTASFCNLCACANDITIDDDKGITFNSLRIESGVTVTNNGSTNSTYSSTAGISPLVFTNGGQLKILRQMSFNKGSEAGALIDVQAGSPVISGSADIFLSADLANSSFFIPALNIYGTTALRVNSSKSNVIINQSGDFNVRDFYLRPVTGSVNWTFNTNNHNITCQKLTFGGATATHTLSGFLGSSNISCTSYDGSTNNIGTNKLYMQSSNIICSGSWAHGSNHTIDPGTSVVNILNTSTVTSNNKAFYDLTINTASGLIATFADPLICSGDFTVTEGATTFNGTTGTFYGDAIIDGTSTHNLGNGITCNGASATFHIGSGVGTITATSCALTMNGTTAMVIDDDKGVTLKSLTLGASAVVTNSGGAITNYYNNATILTLGANATLTTNKTFNLYSTSNNTPYSLGAGYAISFGANQRLGILTPADGYTLTLPAITVTSAGAAGLDLQSNFSTTYNISGNINVGSGAILTRVAVANKTNTLNFSTYTITAGTFYVGIGNAMATINYNFDAATINIGTLNASSNTAPTTGACNINLQTSTWTCSGNWTFGSNHIVDPGTSTVNITNTSTITSASKSFYNLNLSAPGKIITIADDINLAIGGGFALTAGTVSTGTTYCIFAGNGSITLGADLSWRLRTAINSSTITWNTGTNIWTIPAYTLNDWGGTTSTVSWISSSPGSQYKISAPAGIAVNYMNVTDCNNIGIDIDALAVTNVNGGNNLGWLFLGAGGLSYHTRHTDFIINLLTRM